MDLQQTRPAIEPTLRRADPLAPLKVAIVMPVFNDWASLEKLIDQLDALTELDGHEVRIIAVDDGSPERPSAHWSSRRRHHIVSVELIALVCNLGHQRAIAIGLVATSAIEDLDFVVVMDCDGEDRPSDVARLLKLAEEHRGHIVLASRMRRSETLRFRIFYALYKILFRALTGAAIDFGNFCVLPADSVRSLVHSSYIWNNLAAAVIRSRIPSVDLPTERGHRYVGRSQMRFVDLVVHGLSAMSVYADTILVRIILFALLLVGLVIAGMATVVSVRLFTTLAIPGWASNVFGTLSIILLQALIFAGIALFQLLSFRSFKTVIPAIDGPSYIKPAGIRSERAPLSDEARQS